jgi:hypothetical protein
MPTTVMSTTRSITLIVALCCLVPPAFARIGETEAQMIERYGPVQSRLPQVDVLGEDQKRGEKLYFSKEGWQVWSITVDGKCVQIRFNKYGKMTPDQITALLRSNSQMQTWKEVTEGSGKIERKWRRDDGIQARWLSYQGLTITSPKYDTAREAARKAAEQARSAPPPF